jgi:hypothetical protein
MRRLLQKIIRAGLEPAEPVCLAGPAREDDDREIWIDVIAGRSDLPEHVDPGGVGEPQVEDHQVGVVVAAEPERIRGARRRDGAVTVRGQVVAEELAGRVVVLADHRCRQLFDLGEHAPLSHAPKELSPARTVAILVAAPLEPKQHPHGPESRVVAMPLARESGSQSAIAWPVTGSSGGESTRRRGGIPSTLVSVLWPPHL